MFASLFFALQSGISVSDELLSVYESMKLRNTNKYIRFSLTKTDAAGKTYDWSIDEQADPCDDVAKNQEQFNAMLAALPEDSPAFIVFDFCFNKPDGRLVKKLLLIKWCPDTVVRPSAICLCLYRCLCRCLCFCFEARVCLWLTAVCYVAVLQHFRVKPVIGATYQTLKDKLTGLGMCYCWVGRRGFPAARFSWCLCVCLCLCVVPLLFGLRQAATCRLWTRTTWSTRR